MTTTAIATDPTGTRRIRPGLTLVLVCAAMFMLLLDMTIVTGALAAIQHDLRASLSSLQWVVDAYTLPVAGLLLTSATLGDRIGRRRLYLVGMAAFTVASAGCALVENMVMLNLVRAAQGVGAVLLFGVGLPLVAAAFPDARRRAGAIGAFGAIMAAATAVGPLIGGALVDGPGWRWIFLLNVPIGVAAWLVGRVVLVESRAARARAADWPGTALLSGALLALVLGLIESNTRGWGSFLVVGLVVLSAVLLAGFVARERVASAPMLDLSLLRRPAFVGPASIAFVGSATLIASTSYIALYFINTLGYTPFQGGLRFLPMTVTAFLAAPVAARLADRMPARWSMPASGALVALGLLLMTGLDGESSWTHLTAGFVVAGVGLGAMSALISQVAIAAVPAEQTGMATGTAHTFRQIGLAAGVAALGSVFAARITSSMTSGLSDLPLPAATRDQVVDAVGSGAGTAVAQHVPPLLGTPVAQAARDATAAGLNLVFVVGAVTATIVTVAAWLIMTLDRRTR